MALISRGWERPSRTERVTVIRCFLIIYLFCDVCPACFWKTHGSRSQLEHGSAGRFQTRMNARREAVARERVALRLRLPRLGPGSAPSAPPWAVALGSVERRRAERARR